MPVCYANTSLKKLEECGFIRSYTDFIHEKIGKVYQLIDSLSLFHMRFLDNNKVESWIEFTNSPAYYSWSGLAFERVCMLHIKQIKLSLSIAGVRSNVFAWRSRFLLLNDKFTIDASCERELINKFETFRKETGTHKVLFLTMITMNGIVKNQHSDIVVNSLSSEDLFI